MDFSHVFRAPFTLICSGATGSGKSKLVQRLIENKDLLIQPNADKVLYCYGIMNPSLLEMKRLGVEIYKGFPTEEKIREYSNLLLILDDLMSDIDKAKPFLDSLFSRISHHQNISVIFITQSLYHKDLRLLKANTHYLILLRNPSAQQQIRTLASQMYPGKHKHFIESFDDATSQPFNYLLVDSHPQTLNEYRLSSNIFPGQNRTFYMPL